MSDTPETLDRFHREAQELHAKIEANAAKNGAALEADIDDAAAHAERLAASLRNAADKHNAPVKKHFEDAALHLERRSTARATPQRRTRRNSRDGTRCSSKRPVPLFTI